MRLGMPLVTVFALVALAACGGGDEAQPLTLSQRVVETEEAPGSKPDPVEKGQSTTDFDEFITALSEHSVHPDKETMTAVFRDAGFQAAIEDARFFGSTHSPELPHVFSSAIQLESADGAQEALDWFYEDSLKPCPESCAVRISEFDVSGIPEARGVLRKQTAEDIEALGRPEDRPFESYAVLFHDGQFVYSVDLHGPPGSVSEQQSEDIAKALYDKVQGAPPANG